MAMQVAGRLPDKGGDRAAAAYKLLETAKLNGINPQVYLTCVLDTIADHPITRIDELLPWNFSDSEPQVAAQNKPPIG